MAPFTPLETIVALMISNWFILPFLLWVMPWKGIALWKAVRNNHKGWFIVLLVVNTLAILDILYIFVFSKNKGCCFDKECCSEKNKISSKNKSE